jgi:predicted 3-demethylubiquinone-9 3-methyltransferase (glyoxalase superfamily)
MQKITPHLWFDKEAAEAAQFYAATFPGGKVTSTTTLRNTPSGDTDIVSFELWGLEFMAISAGPFFKLNPSVSFMVNFDPLLFGDASRKQEAMAKLDGMWGKLSVGGAALMPLDRYPFSERYGWIQDRYGVSWQLILTDPKGEPRPPVMPYLMFVGNNAGRAEEATDFYVSIFKNSRRGQLRRYPAGMAPDKEGTVMFTDFMLENQWFVAIDSAHPHAFNFNEALSLIVRCDTQDEIDYYWSKLSAVPEAEQCGWLKDKYGLSWQVAPRQMAEMLQNGTREQVDRLTQAFLPMKKFDLQQLRRAFQGK